MSTNSCRACLTPLPPGQRWCNESCRRAEDGLSHDEEAERYDDDDDG